MSLNEKMTALADAIREKSGMSEPMSLDTMHQRVMGLHTFIPPESDTLDPDEVYHITRSADWLPMPVPGDNEAYCLCLIPNGVDGAFTAQLYFSGSCSVEFGNLVNGVFVAKETITPEANTRFYHTVKANDYDDITTDGYKQYLVRFTGDFRKISVILDSNEVYNYGVPYLVEIAAGLKTNLDCGNQTPYLGCPHLRYVRFVGNGQLKNTNGQNFRCCGMLKSVSSEQKATAESDYYSYMFEGCNNLLAVSPNIVISNVGYTGAFKDALSIPIKGINVLPTQIDYAFYYNKAERFDGNQIDTRNCQSFYRFAMNSNFTEVDALNISLMTNSVQMLTGCKLNKLTFSGETTPGGWTIDLASSLMTHSALVAMIKSLPTATAAATITITGNPGASQLTDDEIAVATTKNWTITI